MSGLPTAKKSERKPYLLSRNAHFAKGTLYRLFVSMENFRGTFSLSKGWPLFLAISVCLLLERRLSLHDFVVTEYCFY